jgi:hypothetical protein
MRNKNTKERYYVTWQDTLHPENALLVPNDLPPTAGQVDRWGTVWAEARIVSDDEATSSTQSSSPGVDGKVIASEEASIAVAPMPVAEVTLGNIEDDYETVTTDDATNSLPNRHAAAAAAAEPLNHSFSRSHCSQGRFLDITVGSSLTVAAVAAVFAMEISAIVVYGLAVGFFHTYRQLARISSRLPLLWFLVFVFAFVTQVLKVVDSLLLAISVFLSEVLAAVTCLLCSLFGGCDAGNDWHQYIRRVCHLTAGPSEICITSGPPNAESSRSILNWTTLRILERMACRTITAAKVKLMFRAHQRGIQKVLLGTEQHLQPKS